MLFQYKVSNGLGGSGIAARTLLNARLDKYIDCFGFFFGMGSASGKDVQQENIENIQTCVKIKENKRKFGVSSRNYLTEEQNSVVAVNRPRSNRVVNFQEVSLDYQETPESWDSIDYLDDNKNRSVHHNNLYASVNSTQGFISNGLNLNEESKMDEHSYTDGKYVVCFLCKKQFDDPRFLPCYHTFCCKCLNEYIMSNFDDQKVKCPLCSFVVPVNELGAKGFEKNVILQNSKNTSKPDCDACRTHGVGTVWCIECQQTLCRKCNALHSEDDATKDHSKHRLNEMNQNGLPFCNAHPNKELLLFCVNCQIAICDICNMTKHKLHEAQDVESIVKDLKKSLEQTLEHPDCFKNIHNAEHKLEKEFSRLKAQENEALSEIENHNINVIDLILQNKAELKAEVLAATSESESKLRKTAQDVDSLKSSVYNRFHFAKKLLNSTNKACIATHGAKIMGCLKESSHEKISVPVAEKVEFRAHKLKNPDVGRLFGIVYPNAKSSKQENLIFKISHTFSCSLGNCIVTGLSPMLDDTVWVCAGNDGVIENINHLGEIITTTDLGHPADDITGCKNGKIFISCNGRKEILYINRHGNVKTFIRTIYCTRGLAIDEEENCIVGLTEKPVFFDTSSAIDSYVSCISTGRQIRTYLVSRSIRYPGRIAINDDQSIVISDWIEMAVFVFKNQEALGCYKGNPSVGLDFIPRGVCCTTNGNIIVVDIASNCLHLLSSDASFIRIISELEIIDEPWSVSFDVKERLWIGTQNGQIHMANIL